MPTTDDPELFRERWHDHVEELENLKHTLDPSRWDELQETLDDVHDLVDDAADDYGDS
jgi:hypothetical protein